MKLFLKLLKSVFNILVLSTLIIILFTWSSLSEERRYQLAQKLEAITPFSIFEISHNLKTTLQKQLEKSDHELIQESISLLSDSPSNSESHFNKLDIDCSLPTTKQLQKTNNHKIYQWTDDDGRIHFTDSNDQKNAQDISERYKSRNQFITLNIQPINTAIPLDLNNIIQVSTTKMFMVLSDALKIEQLHQLELSLKLFGQLNEYRSYLKKKAPLLKQAVGFYLAKDNQASVLMQQNSQQTPSLIRHESSHVMMANLYGISPIWLNEGFAEYFQGLKVSGFETSIYPMGYHLQLLRHAKQTGSLSIQSHFNLSVQEWQTQNIEQHYAEAWSIVYFLLSTQKNKKILSEYFSKLNIDRCAIPNTATYFEKHYPDGLRGMN